MRIAMLSTPFVAVPPCSYGGTELVVYELVEGLVDAGHHVTLFATGDSSTRAELHFAYPTAQWPPESSTEVYHVSSAMEQIGGGDFDLVHAHSSVALGFGRLVPDVPLVYTLHHRRTDDLSEFYRHFPKTHFIAISQRQKNLEIPLPRCRVIHHGLDPRRFEWTARPEKYVCFIGRYSEEKGPHAAIDAARMAGLPIRLGGEPHPPDVEYARLEMAHRLREPHVTDLGRVSVAQKVPLLKYARALLAPIAWEEPFGLILIEAMLSGCPVVTFPRGSAPELVESGLTGYLVHSAEEMADVIRTGGILESFDRLACRERAIVRFSRERMVADHLRLYNEVLEARTAEEAVFA